MTPRLPRTYACETCGRRPARRYYLGWVCPSHAPTEAEVRAHAIARAVRHEAMKRQLRGLLAAPTRSSKETR